MFGEIRGTKYEDLDGDGVRDAGEPALAGVTVYIDRNNDGVLDSGGLIEPDDYSAGTQLNTIHPDVTLTAVGSSLFGPQVVAMAPPRIDQVSTGSLVLGNGNSASHVWFDTRQLRMDFGTPVRMLSIDFVGDNNPGYTDQGRLQVFDAGGNLLATYLTGPLGYGDVETMKIQRPTADIAYALAGGIDINNAGLLDRLTFNSGTVAEPTAVTDASGQYAFTGLVPGDYVVREVVPAGYAKTAPAQKPNRLFTVNSLSNQIVELHPTTGAVLKTLAAPVSSPSSNQGLAFDGKVLYFLPDATTDLLYRLDPDTGAAVASPVTLPSGCTTAWRRSAAWCMSSKATQIRSTRWIRHRGRPENAECRRAQSRQVLLRRPGRDCRSRPAGGHVDHERRGADRSGDRPDHVDVQPRVFLGFRRRRGRQPDLRWLLSGSIRVYTRGGTLKQTLTETFRCMAWPAKPHRSAHRMKVATSQIVTGADFGNRNVLGEIRGSLFVDADGDGARSGRVRPRGRDRVPGRQQQRAVRIRRAQPSDCCRRGLRIYRTDAGRLRGARGAPAGLPADVARRGHGCVLWAVRLPGN